MFDTHIDNQFKLCNDALGYYSKHSESLVGVERFVLNEICHFIDLRLPEIKRDYNEASCLQPFWKNYAPLDREKSLVGDQYPWPGKTLN